MTLIDYATGEIVERPTYGQVRESIDRAKASLEIAAEQIIWQIENRAWEVLGHESWDAMREAEYGGAAFMVPRAERPELLARMRRSGLTYREIGATAGVSDETARSETKDLVSGPIANVRGQRRPASYTKPSASAVDPAALAEAAVAEFPDLSYYLDRGDVADVVNMGADLRRFRDRGELDMRLDNLRRSIAVDRAKREGSYRENTTAVMGADGAYRMAPIATPKAPSTCPTCGQAVRN